MSDPRVRVGAGIAGAAEGPLLHELDSVRPIVKLAPALDEAAAAAAAALISCLRRLFPHALVDGDAKLGVNPWRVATVREVVDAIAPAVPAPTEPAVRDVVIAVGDSVAAAEIWVGGGEWTALLGTTPQRVEPCKDGVGLQAAAALAAAEVSKLVLGRLGLPNVRVPGTLTWNLLTYTSEAAAVVEGMQQPRPLAVALMGCGSVGSSAAGLMSLLPSVRGRVTLVDTDAFDPTRNPYRYPASTGLETGKKAKWLEAFLRDAGWDATAIDGRVRDWVRAQERPGFDGIVVSSVDTREGRLEVADVLARDTLSIGVDGLALHLQREHVGDGLRCPFCDFVDLAPALGLAAQIAAQCGIRQERVAQILVSHEPLNAADVAEAVSAGKVRADSAASLVGRRIEDLQRRAYAEATIRDPTGVPVAVSAPYVSWMCGVLAAAELLKAARGIPMLHRRVDLDLSGVPGGFTRVLPADASGRCVCASPVRRKWMARLYGNP